MSSWCADRRKRLGLLVDLALLWELPGPVLYPPSVDLQSNIPLFMAPGSPSLLIEIMRFMMRKNEILQKVTQALVPFSGTWWYLANEIWKKINYQCGLHICPPCLNYEPHAVGQGHILTVSRWFLNNISHRSDIAVPIKIWVRVIFCWSTRVTA